MDEVKETRDIYAAISAYFAAQQAQVASGSGESPELSTLADKMLVQDLWTYCDSLSQEGVGYSIGVAQESLSTGIAVIREIDMCNLVKSEIYGNIESEAEDEVRFYDETGAYNVGVLKGGPTTGSQS